MIFACAFMNFAVVLWLGIYWLMGLQFSTNIPLGYQLVSLGSLVYYLKSRNFEVFRFVQLSLFLFVPFVMQWSIGSSVTASGVTLWGGSGTSIVCTTVAGPPWYSTPPIST